MNIERLERMLNADPSNEMAIKRYISAMERAGMPLSEREAEILYENSMMVQYHEAKHDLKKDLENEKLQKRFFNLYRRCADYIGERPGIISVTKKRDGFFLFKVGLPHSSFKGLKWICVGKVVKDLDDYAIYIMHLLGGKFTFDPECKYMNSYAEINRIISEAPRGVAKPEHALQYFEKMIDKELWGRGYGRFANLGVLLYDDSEDYDYEDSNYG